VARAGFCLMCLILWYKAEKFEEQIVFVFLFIIILKFDSMSDQSAANRYSAQSFEGERQPTSGVTRPSFAAFRPSGMTTPDSDRFSGRFRPTDVSQTSIRAGAIPLRSSNCSSYGGWGFLNYINDQPSHKTWGTVAAGGPEWNDSLVLSETHYHHGDHHHNHHQRHVHHFHDLHLLGSAEEILDLRGTPPVATHIIPGEGGPQMRLRPDAIGRQAFEAGADQYFSSLSARFDSLVRASNVHPSSPSRVAEPAVPFNSSFNTTTYTTATRRTEETDLSKH
jgi:hypothetical protein